MPKIVVYSTAVCPYCVRAKALLERKGATYDEKMIDGDREAMKEMLERSRRKTVPQIFIDEYHVGGYDDLAALDSTGKLDALLSQA